MCTETVGKAHGRIETRTLQATSSLAAYLSPAWPGLAQICRITRRRVVRGQESVETVYAITSLTAEQADAARLLALSRNHWTIENRLHYVRDVTCREDQCRTRARAAPAGPGRVAQHRAHHHQTLRPQARRRIRTLRRTPPSRIGRRCRPENRMTLSGPDVLLTPRGPIALSLSFAIRHRGQA